MTSFASNVKNPADEEEKSQLWWTFTPTPEGDPQAVCAGFLSDAY